MSQDLKRLDRLDGLADELEALVELLRSRLTASGRAGPPSDGADFAAMKRILDALDRLSEVLATTLAVPGFVVDELRSLVGRRLEEDGVTLVDAQ
ncbi:MAG: hypothetical protein JWM12_3292 [Ilumatobacteraceae bacterium]|nr:hypothetical protein [Ilumatobacteraceae bacterium]